MREMPQKEEKKAAVEKKTLFFLTERKKCLPL
jgi:hypothetical protein